MALVKLDSRARIRAFLARDPDLHLYELGDLDARFWPFTFYERAYPGNWFDPRMLETEQFFGVREQGRLVAAGGVHVCSEIERVAALGNIACDPERRGRGLATRVTARLCRSLLSRVDHVGLNVLAENTPAIRCYARLGFVHAADYDEVVLIRRA